MESPRSLTANLANMVEEKKKELMARNPALTALEAHRQAISAVVGNNPDVATLYRADAGR